MFSMNQRQWLILHSYITLAALSITES